MRTYAYVFCEHHQCTKGLSELQNKPGVVIKVLNVAFIASVKQHHFTTAESIWKSKHPEK